MSGGFTEILPSAAPARSVTVLGTRSGSLVGWICRVCQALENSG